MKRFFTSLLAAMILFSFNFTVLAANSEYESNYYTLADDDADFTEIDFTTMSNDELNEYIDSIAAKYSSAITKANPDDGALKSAWRAACQIARNEGYICAATIVEASLDKTKYTILDQFKQTIFSQAFDVSSAYQQYLNNFRNGQHPANSIEFTKADNADLFYALHLAEYRCQYYIYNMPGYPTVIRVVIEDIFDFELDNTYEDMFSSLVNNWAWLNQNAGVLNVMEISISIDESV